MERVTYKDECGYHLKIEYEDVDTVTLLGMFEDLGLEREEIAGEIGKNAPVCIGCPGKDEAGRRTKLCGWPDNMSLCLKQSKWLAELARAALEAERSGA